MRGGRRREADTELKQKPHTSMWGKRIVGSKGNRLKIKSGGGCRGELRETDKDFRLPESDVKRHHGRKTERGGLPQDCYLLIRFTVAAVLAPAGLGFDWELYF